MRDRKTRSRPEQSSHHRILRMRMNTAPRVSQLKRVPEKRRARRFLQIKLRPSEERPLGVGRGRGGLRVRQHEDVCRLDAFFLYA